MFYHVFNSIIGDIEEFTRRILSQYPSILLLTCIEAKKEYKTRQLWENPCIKVISQLKQDGLWFSSLEKVRFISVNGDIYDIYPESI